ncbi:hypothetical protein CYMTET_41795 [Cymbomonas tetramitiformis]|uniref:Heterogeneous nuclear ribonucleoprotein Q acidic domain-containing protein n=1 Tax=Cymbomonas tetramitiformis TaxID=36881 RepID=A0AAE0C6Q6_9CHLO|nr:hypothetical protein CYMTET_41795 [Cymbomonas tetramitiformis]
MENDGETKRSLSNEDAEVSNKMARTGDSEDELYEMAFKKLGPLSQEKIESLYTTGKVKRGELDGRSMQSLGNFKEEEVLEVLEQFGGPNLEGARNKSAYLAGVMKRYRADPKAGPWHMHSQIAQGATREQLLDQIVPAVKKRIDELVANNAITASDIDDRCLEFLTQLPGRVGLQAVEDLGRADLTEIRNRSAYFKSICRRAAANAGLPFEAGGAENRGPPGRPGPYGYEPPRRPDDRGYGRPPQQYGGHYGYDGGPGYGVIHPPRTLVPASLV